MVDSWDAKLYDEAHKFVSEYGQDILKLLAPRKDERILDLGCGTGDLANALSALGMDVIGVDYSEQMIMKAKEKYPTIPFHVKNVLALGYEDDFDAVFSNAVLHWVKSPVQALMEIHKSLQTGGRFIAEFGGEGNVKKITDCIMREKEKMGYYSDGVEFPWYYPSIGDYTSLMEQVGFHVTFAEHIDRPTRLAGKEGLKSWLQMFASSFFEKINDDDALIIMQNIERSLASELFHLDHWIADYKRIRVKGIKRQVK